MLDSELKSKINQLWDKFWSGGISNPIVAIEQMSYLIFMKRLEDEDNKREQNAHLSSLKYQSLFKGKEDCKWSKWANMPADKILDHVRDKVFPFLRTMGSDNSMYQQYMKDAVFVIPTSSLLIEAVKLINEMHIKEQNRDTKGDIYEYLLSELTTAGKNGQFRTPRHIIKMMTELVNPKIGDNVCDPACGTAGFLIAALEHILKNNTSKGRIKIDYEGNNCNFVGDKLTKTQSQILEKETLFGFDFDPTMVRIALMNLMMHGIDNPAVCQMNTLSKRFEHYSYYDVILANPPFKGSIDESDLSESFIVHTKKTELLFLELMYNLLSKGGRCAVIVPEGVLFGNSNAHKNIRKLLLGECRLDAVISMPSGVFKPYAGVSTGILVFSKGETTQKVWFYEMKSDGFTLDDKRTKIDGKGDIPDIINKFKKRKKEKYEDRTSKCFFVPIEEIRDNNYDLSISKYKELEYKEKQYEKPEIIKKKILESENKIIKSLNEFDVSK
ncbi:type I restriction-modification system methyltransferase subunit [Thermoplasmatales archaeon SCGC AB-539-N05]|nr:type I restriction-modification system methyltransferase subunit [Thermoplasmatales archaeon SCGC AB-539-N05]